MQNESNRQTSVRDEFGFDRIEREQCLQAASLYYKIIDSRGPHRSTALVTHIDFEKSADYRSPPGTQLHAR